MCAQSLKQWMFLHLVRTSLALWMGNNPYGERVSDTRCNDLFIYNKHYLNCKSAML